MIGSNPHLVMYDRGSNTHLIRGEVAETQELLVISGRAGRIKVAGGGYISTNYGSYRARLGHSRSGRKVELNCKGIQEITGHLKKHPLQEIHKELRDAELGFDPPLPEYTGVSLLVGLQDTDRLGVYQCPCVDVWGSSTAFTGPHPSFQAPDPQELRSVTRMEQTSRPEKSGYKIG